MRTISVEEAAGDLADTIARVRGDRQPLGIGGDGVAEVVLIPAVELERSGYLAADSPAKVLFDRAGRMARLGYWEWDEITDRCAGCSDELARIYGVTVDEYKEIMSCTQAWLDRIHAEDRDRVERILLECYRRNVGYDVEYRLLRPDGSVLNVREVAEPILDAKGRMIWSTGIVQDLTEQKQMELELRHSHSFLEERVRERTAELRASNEALKNEIAERRVVEDALRNSEEQLRLVTDNLPILIGLVDHEERFVWCNNVLCEWMARSREKIIGRRQNEIDSPDEYKAIKPWVRAVLSGERTEHETTIAYPDGVKRDVLRVSVPAFGPAGEVVGYYFFIHDITAVKQAEERARQSQKMEAVGQLTGGIAHDFNNLLAVIIGNAEMLVEDLADDDPLPRAILRAARRGTELTQRLLAFSRRQPLDPQPVALGEVVDGMFSMLQRTLGESIEIVFTREPGLWPAMADAGQVENALLNLVINARDAMPDGGRLTVECNNIQLNQASLDGEGDVSPGDFVVMAVSDNGVGMPPSVLEHAFEPFFTTKEVGQGSGLGLSMIYGFARQSGGHVTIDSEAGQGTVVKLYLPKSSN